MRLSLQTTTLLGGLLISICVLGGCDVQRESSPESGKSDSTFVNSVGMTFRKIPAGTFRQGSLEGESDERPVRDVEITEPFYLGTREVTQIQWESLMDQNPSHFEGVFRPVDSVSWNRAQAFIDRLNEKEDTDRYRLPTEAEWEYAARGGTSTRFYFGDTRDSLAAHAWYSANSDRRTHRPELKRSNPFGLHDMYGNVWEWTQDAYSPTFYQSGGRVDPVNQSQELRPPRVIRGGGWFSVGSSMRSANRAWAQPDSRDSQLGFRVLREIPPDEQ